MTYQKIAQMKAFKNELEEGSRRPPYSNGKCRIENDIPAGEYSLGVWKNDDGGLSIKLEKQTLDGDPSEGNPIQPIQPTQQGEQIDDFNSL